MKLFGKNLRETSGFTLIEVIAATAIFTILVFTISSFFIHSKKTSNKAFSAQETFSNNIWGIYWITKDLRSAVRHSVGSYIINGGFEKPDPYDSTIPFYWSYSATGGTFQYITNVSSAVVKSGFHSLALTQNASSNVSYDTDSFCKLAPGMAYMVSGWVKGSTYGIRAHIKLVNSTYGTVTSTYTRTTTWQQIACRYPATGVYTNNLVPNNNIKVRLEVEFISGTYAPMYFDNIAVTPLCAVMVTTDSAPTVISTVTDIYDPLDPVGFKFNRWEDNSTQLYRYRAEKIKNIYRIIREKYNTTHYMWEETTISPLSTGIEKLAFAYDINNALPAQGKETPLTVIALMRDTEAQKKNLSTNPDMITIYPYAP